MRWQGGVFLAAALASVSAVAVAPVGPPDERAILQENYPRTLSEFGFFSEPALQKPAPGVIAYRLNTPLYSDGADKLRFLYLPAGGRATIAEDGLLEFPVGTAIVKTFAFGEGDERRLIETRVMLHRAEGWVALPYLWNAEQDEARLVLAGARVPATTPAGEAISYRVPNKNQCKECHGLNGKVIPIGPKVHNLAPEFLAHMAQRGWIAAAPEVPQAMPVWEERAAAPAGLAARAYLDVNCAHCHRPGATASNSGLDLRWGQHDKEALGVFKRPVAAGRGSGGLQFSIVPGEPHKSIMVYRMKSVEPGVAMPELGKATVDREGLEAVTRWIADMD